jgi:hypothetical protein
VAEHDAPFRGYEAVWSPRGEAIYYLRGSGELRCHRLQDHVETTLLRTTGMQHIAINRGGDTLAVGIGGSAVRLTPLGEGVARLIPFAGLTELAWGQELYAGRGTGLWAVPLDGGQPRAVAVPADRLPGIAIGPDGTTLAFAAGREQAEVRSFALHH